MEKSAKFFRVFSNKIRFSILKYLYTNKKVSVTELIKKANISESSISDQLKVLKDADLVTYEKIGLFVYYSLNHEKLMDYVKEFKEKIGDTHNSIIHEIDQDVFNDRKLNVYKILANENRCEILGYLVKNSYSVKDLMDLFYLEQPTISMHLLMLEKGNFLLAKKVGTKRIYSIKE